MSVRSPAPGGDPVPERSPLPGQSLLAPGSYEALERIADQVATDLAAPVAMISAVSTQGQAVAGQTGLPQPWATARWMPLSYSICQHVVTSRAPLLIPDTHHDPQVASNPAVTDLGVIAYAGTPLHGPDGTVIGAVCAIDRRPRHWSTQDLNVLTAHAHTCRAELGWLHPA